MVLAGVRCGSIIAHKDVIGYLKKVISAYPVPRSTANIVVKALSKEGVHAAKEKQKIIKRDRDEMIKALQDCKNITRVYPSQSNFLCIEVKNVKACVQKFYDQKILIRDRSGTIPNAVNIAVGTEEQNKKVLEIFRK